MRVPVAGACVVVGHIGMFAGLGYDANVVCLLPIGRAIDGPGCHTVLGLIVCHRLNAFGMDFFQCIRGRCYVVLCAMLVHMVSEQKQFPGRAGAKSKVRDRR